MPNERNALAELASHMNPDRVTNDDLDKVHRILAELNDVFRTYAFDPHGHSFLLLADRAVKKCRAIAEEGEKK